MKSLPILLVLARLAAAAPAFEPVTRPPFIYVINYYTSRQSWDENFAALAKAPPDMFHMSIFMNWNFRHGPIVGIAEQDWCDYEMKYRPRMSPEAMRERAPWIKKTVERLHATGIDTVVPYVCLITYSGDHEKRTGFWGFYDHWDAYRPLGLYEKPKTDPFQWNQRCDDGTPKYFYPHNIKALRPFLRYAASPAHPDWQRWMRFVVEDVAASGMDGAFVDNANLCRDFGPYGRAAFDRRIRRCYTPDQAASLFGGSPAMQERLGTLAAFETHLTWQDMIRDYLAMVRQAGSAAGKPFVVFPNAAQHREFSLEYGYRDCDLVMFERSRGTVCGRSVAPIVGPFKEMRYHDNVFAYAYTFGLGARVRALVYTGEGRPVERHGYNPHASALTHAEAAAFGGGGVARSPGPIRYPDDALSAVQNRYRAHYRERRTLYDGKRTWPQAAVACFGSQHLYGHTGHVGAANAVFDALLEEHVLTDVLTAPGCIPENLRRYRLIVLPDLRYLSDAQVRALVDYQSAGGRLLVYGQCGRCDEFMRERGDNPLGRAPAAPAFSYQSLRAQLRDCGETLAPVLVTEGLSDVRERWAVKAAAYVDDPRRPRQIILHVLNYNVDLGRGVDGLLPVPSVRVRLPLPPGTTPKSARLLCVDTGAEHPLDHETAAGRVGFTLTDLGVHTICVVELE